MQRRSVGSSAVAGAAAVTAGSIAANIAAYLFHLPASKLLGVDGYGEFASLLAAQLVLAVPALALQSVVAREVVRGRSVEELRKLGHRCAVVVLIASLALSPLVAVLVHSTLLTTGAALVTAPLMVYLATEQGLLQGSHRFGELGVVLAASGVGRVAPAVAVLALGGGAGPVLLVSAAGTGIVALGARLLVGDAHSRAFSMPWSRSGSAGDRSRPTTSSEDGWLAAGSVLAASQVQLALIALSSVDLVIARAALTSEQAGLYALGAVATKAAFWLPQAAGVVLYPRMSNPLHSASALRSALAVVAGIGVALSVGAALVGPLVPHIVGAGYAPVANYLWLFALEGGCLAVLQTALLSAIAGERTKLAYLAWAALVIEVILLFTVASGVVGFLIIAAATALAAAAVVSFAAIRGTR